MQTPRAESWQKLIVVPGFILAGLAAAWAISRPWWSRLVFKLQRDEPERALAHLFDLLDTPDGQIRFRDYLRRTDAELIARIEMNTAAVSRIQDSFEAFEAIQNAHGVQLADIKEQIETVPRLTEAVDRLSTAFERMAETLTTEFKAINNQLSRIDEREKERQRAERRIGQVPTPHRRREGDTG